MPNSPASPSPTAGWRTVLHGASDDLIEVEGTNPDELSWYGPGPATITINGTITVTATYDTDGIWRLTPDPDCPVATCHISAPGEDEDRYHFTHAAGTATVPAYSDTVALDCDAETITVEPAGR